MAQDTIQKFGKYEVVEELGRGAMGVVYKARDPLIGRLVALKTVMPGLLSDTDLLKRFYREAQSAGKLQHPNIVIIHDLGEANGLPYIAMELVEGESLQKIIARHEALPLAAKLRIMVQICRGLGYAHQNGVVHRDIKPANILVRADGTVKVVDFGIVHLADTGMTSSGMVLGTVSYMSPEQLRGEHVDARSDIFSVGIVMYELLSYQKAFDGPNITAVMLKIAAEDPAPLTEVVPGIPPVLDDLVRRCLRKDREERFQTLDDLALELEPLARELQREVLDAMVQQGRNLLAQSEFARAEEVLRSALALDSSHGAAKSLMSKAQTELRRVKISTRVSQYLAEGQRLLEQGKYAEAGHAFEEVIKLDSQHGQARDLLRGAQEALAKSAEVRKRLVAAKRALGEGDLTSAESELRRALETDAEQAEAAGLLEKIRQERAAQERRLRLREGIAGARDMLRQERYDEAVAELQALQKDFPEEAEVSQLLATAQQKIQERQQVQDAFHEVKSLLEQQKFQEAINRAETVRFQFPKDMESTRLYEFAKTESSLAERRQRLELETIVLQEQVKAQKYDEAITHGEQLQQDFPGSIELARLVMLARSEKQATERHEEVESLRRSVQALWDAGKFAEALNETERGLVRFPDDPGLGRMLTALKEQAERRCATGRKEAATKSESISATAAFPSATSKIPLPAQPPIGAVEVAAQELRGRAPSVQPPQPASPTVLPLPPLEAPRKSRVPIAVAAALLIAVLVGIGYKLLLKPGSKTQSVQIGVPASPPATPAPPATAAAGTITGQVTDGAGVALPGVVVTASDQSGHVSNATSAADGSFRLSQLAAGSYIMRTQPPAGYAPSRDAKIELAGSQEQRVNLALPKVAVEPQPATAQTPSQTSGNPPAITQKLVQASRSEAKPVVQTGNSQAVPKQPASAGNGQLVVTANIDGAKIVIDGNDSGTVTPHTFPALPAGSHAVVLVKDGYDSAYGKVQVQAGGSVTANLQLSQPSGKLEFVTVPAGANLTIDGKSYGQTPAQITLPAGKHSYQVSLGGKTQNGTVDILADGFTQKQINLPQ